MSPSAPERVFNCYLVTDEKMRSEFGRERERELRGEREFFLFASIVKECLVFFSYTKKVNLGLLYNSLMCTTAKKFYIKAKNCRKGHQYFERIYRFNTHGKHTYKLKLCLIILVAYLLQCTL